MKMETKRLSEVLRAFPAPEEEPIRRRLSAAQERNGSKIVVLDDDPTGIQTVHGVNVYTDWSFESVLEGFMEPGRMFYILTNSRSFSAERTRLVHAEIARNIWSASRRAGKEFILISRGDSTLRGHWPLETETLREVLEELSGQKIDGEIIAPFFREGNRYTVDDVHYAADGDVLVPAGETEFAKDKTFGYKSSDLPGWMEEKSGGKISREEVCSITLKELRACDTEGVERKLLAVHGFGKVAVNALDTCDIEVFCTALLGALNRGHRFLLRTAAAVPKVLGGISDGPFLTREEMLCGETERGGLVIVGSHVKKTSEQLEELRQCGFVHFIEFNQHLVLQPELLKNEITRVAVECGRRITGGKTVAVYTRRAILNLDSGSKEDELKISTRISEAVTQIVKELTVRPSFIIAKGGITSSDIGVKGLKVKRALVLGQILPGVPVWRTGKESRFPGLPYVIFPGNVGGKTALADAVRILTGKD